MATKKSIPRSFLKWCESHFKDDIDKIDVSAKYDSSLNMTENKSLFKEKFSVYFQEEQKLSKSEVLQNEKESAFTSNLNRLQERFKMPIAFVK